MAPKGRKGSSGKAKSAPTSSASAAELLARSGLTPGRFDATGFSLGVPQTDVPPEISQCLKHVTKRDPGTKLRALRKLHDLSAALDASTAESILPAWLHAFKVLVRDNDKAVRLECARVQGCLVHLVGRKISKHMKGFAGPWWFATSDPSRQAGQAAMAAFNELFPPPAQHNRAVVQLRTIIVTYLRTTVTSSARELADENKMSAEAMEECRDRVVAQALAALEALVRACGDMRAAAAPAAAAGPGADDVRPSRAQPPGSSQAAANQALLSPSGHAGGAEAVGAQGGPSPEAQVPRTADGTVADSRMDPGLLVACLDECLQDMALWRALVRKDEKPGVVNAALTLLLRALAGSRLFEFQHVCMEQLGPLLFSLLADVPRDCEHVLWEAVLSYAKAAPRVLQAAGVRSDLPGVLQRLCATGRLSGSAATGLLPLLWCLLGSEDAEWRGVERMRCVLGALQEGLGVVRGVAATARTATVYAEVLCLYVSQLCDNGDGEAGPFVEESLSKHLPGGAADEGGSAGDARALAVLDALLKVFGSLPPRQRAAPPLVLALYTTWVLRSVAREAEHSNCLPATLQAALTRFGSIPAPGPLAEVVHTHFLEPLVARLSGMLDSEREAVMATNCLATVFQLDCVVQQGALEARRRQLEVQALTATLSLPRRADEMAAGAEGVAGGSGVDVGHSDSTVRASARVDVNVRFLCAGLRNVPTGVPHVLDALAAHGLTQCVRAPVAAGGTGGAEGGLAGDSKAEGLRGLGAAGGGGVQAAAAVRREPAAGVADAPSMATGASNQGGWEADCCFSDLFAAVQESIAAGASHAATWAKLQGSVSWRSVTVLADTLEKVADESVGLVNMRAHTVGSVSAAGQLPEGPFERLLGLCVAAVMLHPGQAAGCAELLRVHADYLLFCAGHGAAGLQGRPRAGKLAVGALLELLRGCALHADAAERGGRAGGAVEPSPGPGSGGPGLQPPRSGEASTEVRCSAGQTAVLRHPASVHSSSLPSACVGAGDESTERQRASVASDAAPTAAATVAGSTDEAGAAEQLHPSVGAACLVMCQALLNESPAWRLTGWDAWADAAQLLQFLLAGFLGSSAGAEAPAGDGSRAHTRAAVLWSELMAAVEAARVSPDSRDSSTAGSGAVEAADPAVVVEPLVETLAAWFLVSVRLSPESVSQDEEPEREVAEAAAAFLQVLRLTSALLGPTAVPSAWCALLHALGGSAASMAALVEGSQPGVRHEWTAASLAAALVTTRTAAAAGGGAAQPASDGLSLLPEVAEAGASGGRGQGRPRIAAKGQLRLLVAFVLSCQGLEGGAMMPLCLVAALLLECCLLLGAAAVEPGGIADLLHHVSQMAGSRNERVLLHAGLLRALWTLVRRAPAGTAAAGALCGLLWGAGSGIEEAAQEQLVGRVLEDVSAAEGVGDAGASRLGTSAPADLPGTARGDTWCRAAEAAVQMRLQTQELDTTAFVLQACAHVLRGPQLRVAAANYLSSGLRRIAKQPPLLSWDAADGGWQQVCGRCIASALSKYAGLCLLVSNAPTERLRSSSDADGCDASSTSPKSTPADRADPAPDADQQPHSDLAGAEGPTAVRGLSATGGPEAAGAGGVSGSGDAGVGDVAGSFAELKSVLGVGVQHQLRAPDSPMRTSRAPHWVVQALMELGNSAMCCAGEEVDRVYRQRLFACLQTHMTQMVVPMEDLTQRASEAVLGAARALADASRSGSCCAPPLDLERHPAQAFQLLLRRRTAQAAAAATGTAGAAAAGSQPEAADAAAAGASQQLQRPDLRPEDSLLSGAASLHLLRRLQADPLRLGGSDAAVGVLLEVERCAVRLLLCAGACLHAFSALQMGPVAAVQHMRMPAPFWDAVAAAAAEALRRGAQAGEGGTAPAAEAIAEFEAWSEETGVRVADAAVALLANPLCGSMCQLAGMYVALQPRVLSAFSAVHETLGTDEIVKYANLEQMIGNPRHGDGFMVTLLDIVGLATGLAVSLELPDLLDAAWLPQGWTEVAVLQAQQQTLVLVWTVFYAHLTAQTTSPHAQRMLVTALGMCECPCFQPMLNSMAALLPLDSRPGPGPTGSAPDSAPRPSKDALAHLCLVALEIPLRAYARSVAAAPGPWACGRGAASNLVPDEELEGVAVLLYQAVLQNTPATLRSWFFSLQDQQVKAAVEAYTTAVESPRFIHAEIVAARGIKGAGVDVRTLVGAREVVASVEVDDGAVLELVIQMPPCFPLQAAEASLRRKFSMSDKMLQKWLLAVKRFLRHENCSVVDAVHMWKASINREFQNVEPCMVCYSIVQPTNSSLPSMKCKTCRQIFHSVCLYKWFRTSAKSHCPHCQTPWLAGG